MRHQQPRNLIGPAENLRGARPGGGQRLKLPTEFFVAAHRAGVMRVELQYTQEQMLRRYREIYKKAMSA